MPSRVEEERSTGKRRERRSRKEHNGDVSRRHSHRDDASAGRDRSTMKPSSERRDEYLSTSNKSGKESQLAVYATVDKKRKSRHRNAEESSAFSDQGRRAEMETHQNKRSLGHRRSTEAQPGSYKQHSDAGTSPRQEASRVKENGKSNGTYFAVYRQDKNPAERSHRNSNREKPQQTQRPHHSTGDVTKANDIKFLRGDEISKIYQHPPAHTTPKAIVAPRSRNAPSTSYETEYLLIDSDHGTNTADRNDDLNGQASNHDPLRYQQQMQESRRALQRLRKSLSENPQSTRPPREPSSATNSSVTSSSPSSSKAGTSGSTSYVSQINPTIESVQYHHEDLAKQVSSDSTASTISQKLLMLTEDKSLHRSPRTVKKLSAKRFSLKKLSKQENSEEYVSSSNQKKVVSPPVQYSLMDVSPLPVRSKHKFKHSEEQRSDATQGNEEEYFISTTAESEILSIGDEYSNFKGSNSEMSTLGSSLKAEQHQATSKTSSSGSSDAKANRRMIFEIDLDAPFTDQRQKRLEEDLVLYREHGIFIPIREKAKPKKEKDLNKWIQTDGPPIRPPKSQTSSTQTGINPCVYVSKRLQMRPWNLPGMLYSNSTQTRLTKLASHHTQTVVLLPRTKACQTPVRTYKEMSTQTKIPPELREFGIQAVTGSKEIETQTADEDNEIWGRGASVSLDRLIRTGALKRTRSVGHGIPGDIECMRDRSSSLDGLSTYDRENGETILSESQKPSCNTSGKIMTYSWSENGKFVKVFVSYSGVHLIPTENIQITTNGISLNLTILEEDKEQTEEPVLVEEDEAIAQVESNKKPKMLKSTLNLSRLRRPVSSLTYNVQRDMITIILRKQKRLDWNTLLYQGNNV